MSSRVLSRQKLRPRLSGTTIRCNHADASNALALDFSLVPADPTSNASQRLHAGLDALLQQRTRYRLALDTATDPRTSIRLQRTLERLEDEVATIETALAKLGPADLDEVAAPQPSDPARFTPDVENALDWDDEPATQVFDTREHSWRPEPEPAVVSPTRSPVTDGAARSAPSAGPPPAGPPPLPSRAAPWNASLSETTIGHVPLAPMPEPVREQRPPPSPGPPASSNPFGAPASSNPFGAPASSNPFGAPASSNPPGSVGPSWASPVGVPVHGRSPLEGHGPPVAEFMAGGAEPMFEHQEWSAASKTLLILAILAFLSLLAFVLYP